MYISYEVIIVSIFRMKNISAISSPSVLFYISDSDQIKGMSKNGLKNIYIWFLFGLNM